MHDKLENLRRAAGAGRVHSESDNEAHEQSGAVLCNINKADGAGKVCREVQLLRFIR